MADREWQEKLDAIARATFDAIVNGESFLDESDPWAGPSFDNELDAYCEAQLRPGDVNVRNVVVVLGTGGPHVEVAFPGDESMTVRVFWSGTAEVHGAAPEWARQWAESFAYTLEG